MIRLIKLILLAGISLLSLENTIAGDINISGSHIILDGEKFIIKGICYNPVEKGQDKRSFSNIDEDLKIMNQANINTIRVYSPITDIKVLDKINDAGIKVIMSFGYNQNGNYDILSGTFINYVKKYKDHEAILMWELGNEYNYHPEWFNGNIQNWYTALNNGAKMIKEIDLNHPVTTAHGELPDIDLLEMCDQIDVWGMNVYRWDNPEEIFAQWSAISSKPMYLSEAGADSYMVSATEKYKAGENQQAQADAVNNILEIIFNHKDVCSGVALFAFTDELWKAGNNDVQDKGGWAPNSSGVPYDGAPNEEYWGILDVHRNKKLAFEVVKSKYKTIP
ncbi:MAG: hypothetical protein C0595_03845 [Marinilabiliales bacterium]|nr:MAG: hypothetical protein C0595_03845 [Marinilabiliales bacterium]